MASLDDVVNNLNNGVQSMGRLVQVIEQIFPQQTGTSATATAGGGAAIPATTSGFIVVNIAGVGVRKIPYYLE